MAVPIGEDNKWMTPLSNSGGKIRSVVAGRVTRGARKEGEGERRKRGERAYIYGRSLMIIEACVISRGFVSAISRSRTGYELEGKIDDLKFNSR